MSMSLGLLAGIIAGAVGLTSSAIILVVLGLRRKHKRLLSEINSAGERRLSGFRTSPSAIMSITDEDVARMPGTRASVHRSPPTLSNRNSLYTPMASRESLPRPTYNPKAGANDRDEHEPVATQQSWPLPRRMTRADGTPLVKLPSSTLTPVTERSQFDLPSPSSKDIGKPADTPRKDEMASSSILDPNRKDGDVTKSSVSPGLTPKPLFHGQQRSSSHGIISGLADGNKTEPRGVRRTSQIPRSKSMYSQEPGLAPMQPLPPLPLRITSKRFNRVRSPERSIRRASGGSLFSEQTSILDDNWSKAFSQAGTDFTSITLASSRMPASTPKGPRPYEGNHVVWDSAYVDGRASPIGAAKQMSFRPQLNTQRSFRASVQESLPRSQSSGLSLSMSLHGPSRAESRASLAKDPSSTHSKSRVTIPRSAEKRKLRRGISPSSPLRRTTDFTIHDDTKSKRTSTSTLYEISGNEGSPIPSPWDKRARSLATGLPLEWDVESLSEVKPSTTRDRAGGNERRHRIGVSDVAVIAPSPVKPPAFEEQQALSQGNPEFHNNGWETIPKQTTFRPPSRQDFDFALQMNLDLSRATSRITNNNSPFSPTQFMVNLYREDDNSADIEDETPTRKPSSRKPPSTHPNRRKTIFDDPTPAVWPLAAPPRPESHPDPSKRTHDTTANTSSRQSLQSTSQDSNNPDSRPTSFLLNFPWPPTPKSPTTAIRRGPKTPIRGPRPAPFRYISPNSRRRSPIRNSGISKQQGGSPIKDLRRSVAALRRMNSEVVSSRTSGGRRSREHKRYLSIGDGSAVLEKGQQQQQQGGSRRGSRIPFSQGRKKGGGNDDSDGGTSGLRRADEKENLTGPRDMGVFDGKAKLSPTGNNGGNGVVETSPSGSMYDRDGFLKELDAWLR